VRALLPLVRGIYVFLYLSPLHYPLEPVEGVAEGGRLIIQSARTTSGCRQASWPRGMRSW